MRAREILKQADDVVDFWILRVTHAAWRATWRYVGPENNWKQGVVVGAIGFVCVWIALGSDAAIDNGKLWVFGAALPMLCWFAFILLCAALAAPHAMLVGLLDGAANRPQRKSA